MEIFLGILILPSEHQDYNVNKLGFNTVYSLKNRIERKIDLENSALVTIKRHTEPMDRNLTEKLAGNKAYITNIIEKCKSKDIIVILLTTPVVSTYYENMNIKQQEMKEEFCESFV